MELRSRWQRWLLTRKHFPVRWLTYKQRISIDIARAMQEPDFEKVFGSGFVESLKEPIQKTEDWIIKLLSFQVAITAFFVLGFISDKPSVSLFGVSVANIVGLKEILLAVWISLGAFIAILSTSKDTLIFVAEKIFEQRADKRFQPFTKLLLTPGFNLRVYMPREYEDWIFPVFISRMFFGVLSIIAIVLFVSLLSFSVLLSFSIFRDIYIAPTLGGWSYVSLAYSAAVFVFNFLWAVRFSIPFPYRDQSKLKRAHDLEKTDPSEARKLRDELFRRSP